MKTFSKIVTVFLTTCFLAACSETNIIFPSSSKSTTRPTSSSTSLNPDSSSSSQTTTDGSSTTSEQTTSVDTSTQPTSSTSEPTTVPTSEPTSYPTSASSSSSSSIIPYTSASSSSSTTSTTSPSSSTSIPSTNASSSSSSKTSSSTSEQSLPAIDYVKVFALSEEYSTIYAWIDTGGSPTELLGGWPGAALQTYDDKWLTYDFIGYTSLKVIFSKNGASQTSDLSITHAGYYWVYQGNLISQNPDTIDPSNPPTDIPQGNYELVTEAITANDLPAVKNYNKGKVLYPYNGSRTDFRDESIYFTITTRFYDGDKSNNVRCWDGKNNSNEDPEWRGDFKGLIEKMDYIKALGFTAIWITPVVKNASGYDYHGYHAINFKEVDPRYESTDVNFSKVIEEAHKRDMKIILDVVFNHTCNFGEENLFPMFNYDVKNDPTPNGMKRNENSGLLDNSYDYASDKYQTRIDTMKGYKDAYNIYHHEKSMAYEQYIEQTGQMAGDCVDLNTENPTVANYLVEAFGEFIRLGVDAFRIDTVKHISRLTFNNYIWPGLYKIAEKCENKYFYMFGEVCTRERGVWNHGLACDSAPFYTWKESKEYAWGDRLTNEASTLENWNDNINPADQPTSTNARLDGLAYHMPDHSKSSGCGVIDFPMHWNFQYARDAYNVAVSNDQYYNDATYNVVYVDSHDYGPDCIEKVRYNMGETAWKENLNLMFTFRGIPCLYYGSEIQFQAGKTIDEGPNIALANSGRAYYGDHLEGSVSATNFGEYTASGEVKTTLNNSLSKHIQMLNKIRLKVPALRRGQYALASSGEMAYVRRYTTKDIDSLACVSVSGNASFNSLPNGKYVDLVSGNIVNVTSGTLNINISGQGSVAIYVLENSSTGTLGKI